MLVWDSFGNHQPAVLLCTGQLFNAMSLNTSTRLIISLIEAAKVTIDDSNMAAVTYICMQLRRRTRDVGVHLIHIG